MQPGASSFSAAAGRAEGCPLKRGRNGRHRRRSGHQPGPVPIADLLERTEKARDVHVESLRERLSGEFDEIAQSRCGYQDDDKTPQAPKGVRFGPRICRRQVFWMPNGGSGQAPLQTHQGGSLGPLSEVHVAIPRLASVSHAQASPRWHRLALGVPEVGGAARGLGLARQEHEFPRSRSHAPVLRPAHRGARQAGDRKRPKDFSPSSTIGGWQHGIA